MKLTPIAALALFLPATAAFGQIYDWQHNAEFYQLWSNGNNWSPGGPPLPTGSVVVSGRGPDSPLGGPTLDVDATIAHLNLSGFAFTGAISFGLEASTGRTFNVTGTTALTGPLAGVISAVEGCTYSLGTLANQSNATFTSGNLGAGTGFYPERGPAIIQWRGANVVRNEGSLGLGPGSVFRDQDTFQDALRNFSQNAGVFGVVGRTFTSPGTFTNFGLLDVLVNDYIYQHARFQTGGTFVNFDANTGVLNGGAIRLRGLYGGRAEFAFPGADIRTLAPFTTLLLVGDAAILDSTTGENGLRHLGSLGGDLSVATALGLTPAGGTFELVSGTLDVLTNGNITVVGNFQQYTGASTNLGQNANGTAYLAVSGNVTVEGSFYFDGPVTSSLNNQVVLTADLIQALQDSFVYGSGDCYGDAIFGGTFAPGIPLDFSPRPRRLADKPELRGWTEMLAPPRRGPVREGAATPVPGRLTVQGGVTLTETSTYQVSLIGPVPGTGHSVLEQTGASGVLLGGGQLVVTLGAGYAPAASEAFEIITADALEGAFANAGPAARIVTADGLSSFRVQHTYSGGRYKVVLTDFASGPLTVFTGQSSLDSVIWSQPDNWTLDVPGAVAFNLVIPSGFQTLSSGDYPGLDSLFIQAGSSHTMIDAGTLEFRRGLTLEAATKSASGLYFAGQGTGVVATNAITAISRSPNELGPFQYLGAGLELVQSGTEPTPFTISKQAGGILEIQSNVIPFRGSTLTLDAQANPVTSGYLRILGSISEREPAKPSASGAAVVVNGGGITQLLSASSYSGSTLVRNSGTPFGGGSFFFSGGLYADNSSGSATGSGSVTVVSTAGASSESDNFGILAGTGRLGGDVSLEGGVFLPGNGLFLATPVGTLRFGGNLTLTGGPRFGGTASTGLLIDLDPQSENPSTRTDLILLESPNAQVSLQNVSMAVFLRSPPQPGDFFRILDAPDAGQAITGTLNGLPDGATVSTDFGGVTFGFEVRYGSNYIQLEHVTPPATSYAYLRLFYFNAEELADPARSGPFGDYNGDGLSNLLAYALGADPRTVLTSQLPRASTRMVTGTTYGVIEIQRALPRRPDVQYLVAETTNLTVGFGAPFDLDDSVNAARVVSATDNGDGTETIAIRASSPLSANPHGFLRLSLNYVP